MDKFTKHAQSQRPKRHRSRFKLGRRRQAGTTAEKKAKGRVKVNERVLELEAEVKTLRRQLVEVLEGRREHCSTCIEVEGKNKALREKLANHG